MSKWDIEYLKLCRKILNEGTMVDNRTKNKSIKIPAYTFEFNLEEEFPILTTKKLYIRQAVLEMLWIYQVQSNDVSWLKERNIKIWNLWEIDEKGYWRAEQNIKQEDGTFKVEEISKYFGKEYAGTIGTAYGYIVKKYGLIDKLINDLKNNPNSRRMVMSLYQNEHIETGVLEPCVWSSEWDVTDGYLNAWVHQRSCDVPLGLPFNVTQYATLLHMLAQVTNLKPGKMYWSIKDAHIYENELSGIKEQLEIFEKEGHFPAPEFWLNPEITDFYDFDNSIENKDVKVKNYKYKAEIKFPLTQ